MASSLSPTAALGAAVLFALGASVAHAAESPTVIQAVRHDTSAPLRDILATLPPEPARGDEEAEGVPVPNILLKPVNRPSSLVPDYGAIQSRSINAPAPAVNLSFDAINSLTSGCGCLPPDTNGDVSDQHYIQWVNSSYQIFDKTSGTPHPLTLTPKLGNSFFTGFGGKCETTNSGDPIALWDARAQRWVMSQFVTSSPFAQCVAVSTSADPLGSYYRYEFNFPIFGDYPKMGVWTDESGSQDAYLLITHDFNAASAFQGSSLIALERDKMLAGQPAAMLRYAGHDAYGVQPINLSGQLAAPANACPSFVHFDSDTADYLFWDLCLNWTNPSSSTITPAGSPIRIAAKPFAPYYDNVPQQGTANGLNSFGSNLMYRATGRAFPADAPTRLSLVVNHTVQGATQQAGIRWVHFDLSDHGTPAATPTALDKKIVDQGVYAPDDKNRWMGGIAIDQSGNIGVGYSHSSSTSRPQIMINGRTPADPEGTLRDEQNCTDGVASGSQTSSSNRWGDYTSMSVDPVDQCTFYFTTEYYATTSASSWRTRVCSFKFDGCGSPDFALVAESPKRIEMCSATDHADPGYSLRAGVFNGFTGNVALSANGAPAGTTPTFGANPLNAPGGTTLTLGGGASLAAGEYTFDIEGTSGSTTRALAGLSLGLSETAPDAPALVAPADASTGAKVRPTLRWEAMPQVTDRIFGDGFDGGPLPSPNGSPANAYRVDVATDAGFANIVARATVNGLSWTTDISLDNETSYFWRVTPVNYCGDGTPSATFSFTTGIPGQCPSGTVATQLFFDDMQGGVNGWTTDGTGSTGWSQRAAPAGTGLTGTVWGIANNATTSDRGLISPAVAIPSGVQATILSFDTFHKFEDNGPGSCWDNGSMEIKAGTGAFTYLDGSRLFTDPYDGIAAPGEVNAGALVWCHAPTSTPTHSVVDLDGFEGQSVQLRWRAVSDPNTTAPAPNGMYVKNVKVEVCQ
ncbi:hypothetical protein [Dokdonella sp.]|uniref:hypothetical protein n=1 Tax=Dokdonella sp. TaxID=2291710 RepID=UPI0026379FFE|nr:hypothetical protein [Dokdonella sp.]